MRQRGFVWLGATVAILGAAACFSPPTGTKATSPSMIVVTEFKAPSGHSQQSVGTLTYANIAVGDTMVLGIQVKDETGFYYAFSAPTFASGNAGVANLVEFPDTALAHVPGNTLFKAYLIGVATGTTSVQIQAAGLTDTVAVNVN